MGLDGARVIWLNGGVVAWDAAAVHVASNGLHYGTGVFEGIRCYDGRGGPAVFRLGSHLDRLVASAALLDMRIPYSRARLERAVVETVAANGLSECYVRILCTLGPGSLALDTSGLDPQVAIIAWPWAPLHGPEWAGVRLSVSRWRKTPSVSMPSTAKACGQYLNGMLAVRDARARGFDEALLLAPDGTVAEAATENVFAVRGGRLLTNDERSPILLGVTRDSVLELARGLGVETEVRPMHLDDLLRADEVFLTGTAAEIAPVAELDGARPAAGAPGPVTRRLQRAFRAATTGEDRRRLRWLTPVGAAAPHPRDA